MTDSDLSRELARELGVAPDADLLEEVRKLREAAYTDSLTGLPNRRALERDLLAPDRRRRTILLLDLDRFKRINDEHGHAAGDKVLCHAAKQLRERLRSGDTLYRLGGDEFAVLLRSEDMHGARTRLTRDLRTPGLPTVGVSAGAGRTVAEADRRMYAHKRDRRR